MATTENASPGWYADPSGKPQTERRWDGSQWTDETRLTTSVEPADGLPAPRSKPKAPTRRLWVGAAALTGMLAVVSAALVLTDDDEEDVAVASTSTTAQPIERSSTTTTRATTTTTRPTTTTKAPTPVDRANYALVVNDPADFEGSPVTISGRVFTLPERGAQADGFQMFAAPGGEWNTLVIAPPGVIPPDVREGTYVTVTGTIAGASGGTNAFGGSLQVVQIVATSVVLTDATAMLGAPLASVLPGASLDQHGLTISITRVDQFADRTLVHLTAVNGSGLRASVYEYSMKVVQGAQQFDVVSDFELPRWQSEVLPGVITNGIVRFPAFDVSQPFQLVIEGRTEDYRQSFTDFVFQVG